MEENTVVEEQSGVTEVVEDAVTGDVNIHVYTSDDSSVVVSALDPTPELMENTMPAIVESLFGSYMPRTQTITVTNADGSVVTSTEVVPGLAGVDFLWLSGVLTFSIVLCGFFGLLRVVIKRV